MEEPKPIPEPCPKIVATLYVADGCARSRRATRLLANVVAAYEPEDAICTVRDVAQAPADEHVAIAPTLVLRHPLRLVIPDGPVDTRMLRALFDMVEAQRRR